MREIGKGETFLITLTTGSNVKTIRWQMDNVTRTQIPTHSREYLICEVGNYVHKWLGFGGLTSDTHVNVHGDCDRSPILVFTFREWADLLFKLDETIQDDVGESDYMNLWAT